MDALHTESLESVRAQPVSLPVVLTAPQLLASLRRYTSPLPAIPALPALHRGEAIEIQGPASSGKTHLLYHILLAVLVPDADAEIPAAVVYDTDASFDIQRFRHLLLSRVSRLDLVRRSLARLHVFRPTSLAHLAASIANLPAYHASHMPNQEIAVLAVDSLSTFYWPDRFSAEQLRNIAPDSAIVAPLHRVFSAIRRVQRSHAPLVVLTNWALGPPPSGSLLYRQHLHPPPVLEDAVADLGAKPPGNTDHSPSSPFRLAHHIALSSPSSDQPSAMPSDDAHLPETRHTSKTASCFSSSSGTVRFTFQITDDGIFVWPQPPTELVMQHHAPSQPHPRSQ